MLNAQSATAVSTDSARIPESLKIALRNGKVVPFVGSGISRAVRRKNVDGGGVSFDPLFPSWEEYIKILASALDYRDKPVAADYIRDCINAKPPDYLGAMQVAFDKLGETDWDGLLDRHFDFEENEADSESLEFSRLIWQISSNLIITTNIDRVLQWTCPNPKEFKILESQKKGFGKLNKANPPKCPTVVYFHGHIDNKASIIFTKEQYDHFYNYKNNEAKLETLRLLLAQGTFLFVGFSLDDPYFLQQLHYFHKLYEGGADSFFVLIHKDEKDNSNIPDYVRKIVFEDYGAPLLNLLRQLSSIARGTDDEIPRALIAHSAIPPSPGGSTGRSSSSAAERARKATDKRGEERADVGGSLTGHVQSERLSTRRPAASGVNLRRSWVFIVPVLVALAAVYGLLYLLDRNHPADSTPIDSVAVLPFQNDSLEPDTDYLAASLTNELRYSLSYLPNLTVSPKTLAMRYKGKETDPIKAGSELGVRAVLTGTITQRGDNLTISVELIDVLNKKLIWGNQYDRKVSELLATQKEIARVITQELKLKLAGERETALTKRYKADNEAYLLYQRGRFFFAKRTKGDVLRGIGYFKQATARDPDFALAYVGIANAYNATLAYAYVSPEEALPQAKKAALRALEINPTLAEAHAALAYSLVVSDWNWAESEREFKRALELDPNDDESHFRYGMVYLMTTGRPGDSDEAVRELKRSLELEPMSLVNNSILASTYLYGRQYHLALEQARVAYDYEPNFVLARWNLGYAYIANEKYAEAIALSKESLRIDPTAQFMLRIAGIAYAKSGRRKDAEGIIKRLRKTEENQYVSSYYIASIYAALGDKEKAFSELETSFAKRDWDLHRLKVDPFMDPLHNDPRFAMMLRRLNLLR